MGKVFEDYFSELQADMVSICLEYVAGKGDNIYIYCSHEKNVYSVGYFYKINGKMKERHKVNEELPNCDVSINQQKLVMKILMDDLKKIEKLCNKFEKPIPTEIKIVYVINSKSLNAKYQYAPVYSMNLESTADDIEQNWFEEIKNKKRDSISWYQSRDRSLN